MGFQRIHQTSQLVSDIYGKHLTRDFFLWCMSAIYLVAFASLFVQIPGLYGDNGVLPAKLVVETDATSLKDLFTGQPTLLRVTSAVGLDVQTGMDVLCLAGIILSFVAMISSVQRNCIVFGLLWALYLSLYQVGQTFLSFQWDILLLETGFLTLILAPLNKFGFASRPVNHQHDTIGLWLVKWLTFRLMYASGVVKLTSGCPTWWGLTALNIHFESQCIPTPLAWWAHQLPEWFLKLGVVATFVYEIPIPVMFFSPVRSQRVFAFYTQVMLMFLIILTGNYNFFNWLYMVVCLPLVTDGFLRRWMGYTPPVRERNDLPIVDWLAKAMRWVCNIVVYGGLFYWTVQLYGLHIKTNPFSIESTTMFDANDLDKFLKASVPVCIWIGVFSLSWEILAAIVKSIVREPGLYRKVSNLVGCAVIGSVACCLFSVSLVPFTAIEPQMRQRLAPEVKRLHSLSTPYKLTSSYGLFRRMTGVGGRPEVIIEGSDHLEKGWKEYEFLYKPGNVSRRPPIVAPHQPRLDWQMWFAALGSYNHNPWLVNLVYRLLNNQPEVLALMGKNPFPNKPPKYIRANLYHYHYTQKDPSHQWYSKSDWWVREKVREYLPAITLEDKGLVEYLKQAGIYEKKKSKRSKKRSQAFIPDFLEWFVQKLRSFLGQTSGFTFVVSLVMTGLVLNLLKPSLKSV